jgi:CubicO group peptidase (beta-lactamase class C family)
MKLALRTLVALAAAGGASLLGSASSPAQTGAPSFKAAPPAFADQARRQKLVTAFPEIDRLMQDFVSRGHVAGAAWGVIIDGELAHTGAAGYRELASKAPVDADTVFRIASMTKSFTAMSILKLRDEGTLSLDDAAERYVPELASLDYPTTDSPHITIRHLLSHAEGFPEDNPWGDRQLADSDAQLAEMIRGGIPFSHAPGLAYEYSNYGFAILGRLVARVSGVAYTDYVTTHILRPLAMASTTLEPASVPANRLAHGYRWEDEQWKEEPQLANGSFGSMGGMLTSIRDLSRFVAVFLNAWPPRDEPELGPIRRASLREMQQLWRPGLATATLDRATSTLQLNAGGYAFGLGVSQTCEFGHVVAHGGGLPGFGSIMRWLPEYGVGIVALGNLTYTSWGRVTGTAFDALARTGGLKKREAQPSPALIAARDAVSRLVTTWDDGLADSIAAANLFLDRSKDRRRREIEVLRSAVGECRADARFDVENALRGQWTMACERGALRVAITLAPTMPPKVQFLDVRPAAGANPPRFDACEQ